MKVMPNLETYEQWIRTCQECGYKQKAIKPSQEKELTDSYRNSKCRKCRSEALDYGKFVSSSQVKTTP
jgi:predicted Zn-ribbon and HTH transcriptional regulator